jgi:hypothetical protein
MRCAIYRMVIDSIDEAREQGRIPCFYEGEIEHGPVCPSCSEKLICRGEDGEMDVKEEYRGKIGTPDDLALIQARERIFCFLMKPDMKSRLVLSYILSRYELGPFPQDVPKGREVPFLCRCYDYLAEADHLLLVRLRRDLLFCDFLHRVGLNPCSTARRSLSCFLAFFLVVRLAVVLPPQVTW